MSVTIANIWLGIPFNLVILYSGLQNIPTDLYEAASLDGAGPWRQFWSITFPLLRPVTAITLLLGFVYTLKVVDIIWIMTMGTGSSQTLATWAYAMAFGKGASAVIKYSAGLRRRHDPAAHRPAHGVRVPRRPASAGGAMNTVRRTWWKTAIGVVLVAIMLFPVYWMVNVSLTPRDDIRNGDLYPKNLTFEHYARRAARPAAVPARRAWSSGSAPSSLTLAISAPAAFALSQAVRPGPAHAELPADRRADDPGRRHGARLLHDLLASSTSSTPCPA